ncbi:hypothetical protein RB595_007542 [Gaeumannomyces hyphopodioides]
MTWWLMLTQTRFTTTEQNCKSTFAVLALISITAARMSPFQALSTSPTYGGLLCIEPDQLEQFTALPPVRFLVGHDRVEFYIHANLLSPLSAPLHALVNGSTQVGYVTCDDVDKDTFSRLVEFVYTGAFTGFSTVQKDGSASKTVGESTASVEGTMQERNPKRGPFLQNFDLNVTGQGGKNKDSPGDSFLSGLLGDSSKDDAVRIPCLASYTRPAPEGMDGSLFGCSAQHQPSSRTKRKLDVAAHKWYPSQKKRSFVSGFMEKYAGVAGGTNDTEQFMRQTKPTQNATSFKEAFIGYIRIWAFADRFGIHPLMDRASLQLAHELARWTILPSAFVPDFGGLVRYVYGNQRTEGCQPRQLVAAFAACVVEDVSGLEGWPMLLEEIPAFAADLIVQMTQRID